MVSSSAYRCPCTLLTSAISCSPRKSLLAQPITLLHLLPAPAPIIYFPSFCCIYCHPPNATKPPTSNIAYIITPKPPALSPLLWLPPGPAAILSVEAVFGAGSPSTRLRDPMTSPSRISRASSECPTSSKASVASWPPTSRRTSSPPLTMRVSGCRRVEGKDGMGVRCGAGNVCLRVLINERRGIVDFIVDDDVEIFLGRVLRYFFVGDFLFRHFVCLFAGW